MRTISRLSLIGLLIGPQLPAAAAPVQGPAVIASHPGEASQALNWRLVGPFRGGRTRAVSGIPGEPATFLVGAVDGGVWKTDDDGRTWNPLFDAAPTQSIGAIAIAPSDPAIIYVASGEGLLRPDLSVGNGIYRSSDSGLTWTHLGLDDAQQIPDLAVDPHDPNVVYAAVLGHPFGPSAQRGIYRSRDGGRQWTQVLHVDDDTGGSCVKIDPNHANVLYAALWNVRAGPWEDRNVYSGKAGGLYKSSDGGEHWRRLTQGLPENLVQVEVAVAPSGPGRLYATVASGPEGDYSSAAGLGVYRSDDAGESWTRATVDPRPALRIGGGDLPIIKVDPRNADVLYSASLVTMKSMDGGHHWSALRGSPGGDDYQNLWISPDDGRHIALVGDQGAIVTVNGGATWSSWLNQPTAQLYHIGIADAFPYRICSGQQESGSVCISSRGNDGEITIRNWQPVGVIEYGYVVPDPLDPDIVYGAGRNVVTKMHLSTGQVQDISPLPLRGAEVRVDRTEPLLFSPKNPHRLYYAASHLYESTDGGDHWRAISPDLTRPEPQLPPSVGSLHLPKAEMQRGVIYAASASALQEGVIWTGTDDGLVWVTRDDGAGWQNATPPPLTPWSKVTQIEASHFDSQGAYVAVSRFRVDDLHPYIYRTRDGGKTWTAITAGLPDDAPVNTVREDPVRRGLLFAGTENSVWVSYDDGDHWNSLQLNLPHTSMRDLAIHERDLIVATHGRSFWILDDISPLRQFTPDFAAKEAALLRPAVAIRVKRSTGTDTPIQPDEPMGRNPPDGAVIDYFLAHDSGRPVTLEILDSTGAVVRSASSTDPAPFTQARLERELIPTYWLRMAKAPAASAGMHRWVWDLHYASPRSVKRGFPISAVPGDTPEEPLGPAANPGDYRVRLTIGAHQWSEPLAVKADPRIKIDAGDFKAQFELARRLAGALDGSSGMLLAASSLRAQLKNVVPGVAANLAGRIQSLDDHLAAIMESADAGTAPRRGLERLNGDFAALYAQVSDVDAAPTAAQALEANLGFDDWSVLQAEWQQVRDGELAPLNRDLKKARLAVLREDLEPPRDLDFADQE